MLVQHNIGDVLYTRRPTAGLAAGCSKLWGFRDMQIRHLIVCRVRSAAAGRSPLEIGLASRCIVGILRLH